jgi:hypothetical protein
MLKGNIKLVAITGAAGAGKDVLAQALSGQCGYQVHKFAETLYKMVYGLPFLEEGNWLNREWKERPHAFYNGKSPRRILQTLGTEWMRGMISEDQWVAISEHKVYQKYVLGQKLFVFSDCRFENEAAWVRKVGGLIVHLKRDQVRQVEAHSSEAGIQHVDTDLVISNNDTIEALCQQAARIDVCAEERMHAVRS